MQPEVEIFGALATGATDRFKSLLDEHPDLVNARNENGDSLLLSAVYMGRKDLFELHHGFGTWVRNALLHVAGGNAELVADCARVLEAARKERIAKNPVLASLDPRFEELRPPIDFDDCSMVIIERVWEALNARDVH